MNVGSLIRFVTVLKIINRKELTAESVGEVGESECNFAPGNKRINPA